MGSRLLFAFILMLISTAKCFSGQHPGLLLTPAGVKEIRSSAGKYPLFDRSLAELTALADGATVSEIIVPVPKDGGGGYTHEKHKNNYYVMEAAGILYQLTGNKKYASFVRNMLMEYARMYPSLGLHPAARSATPGKLFWQALNEAVWLVHTANAYDCVYHFINESDRQFLEKNLFYPVAGFISNGNKENYAVFNKMHNHGTWATAAVGMIGYVMDDKDMVDRALFGSNKDGKTGFIRQLEVLFSPDGYFTEGPYYQRYALWPFMTFAQVIQNQQPELKIFSHRDRILLKAVDAMIQLAYNGELFYLNDALTKTYQTQELVIAVDIAFKNNPQNRQLLTIARQQEAFVVSDAGLATARAVYTNKEEPFTLRSSFLRDGKDGDEGGLAILRSGSKGTQTCLTFKATAHGLSHGHYDKLSVVLYDNGNLILPDYGAVRFLNIEPKNGGHYTRENYTWGMQTIAHNTITIDEKSHFNADINRSSRFHSEIDFVDFHDPELQVVSGSENNAYPGVNMQRTVVLLKNSRFENPVIIDIFRVQSDSLHQIDLAWHYRGHPVSTTFGCQRNLTEQKTLGTRNGYQHLWLEAAGRSDKPVNCFTWVNGDRFYSISALSNCVTEFLMARTGANDPDFNLRSDPCLIIRQPEVRNHTFISIVEPHGKYDLSREVTAGFSSTISEIRLIADNREHTLVKFSTTTGVDFLFVKMNSDFDTNKQRVVDADGILLRFTGNYYLKEIIKNQK